jgi:isomerase DpgB
LFFCDGVSSTIALELLLVVDRRIVTSHFLISDLYFEGSIWPGMSLFRLSRQLGEAHARKLYFEARQLTSSSALSMGIADEVVDDFDMALNRLAVFLDVAPISDYAIRRRLMQDSQSLTFEDALGAHLAACDRALRS